MFDVQRELNEEDIDFMMKSSTSSFEKRLKVYRFDSNYPEKNGVNKLKGYSFVKSDSKRTSKTNLRVTSKYVCANGNIDGQYFEPANLGFINHHFELKAEERIFWTWKVRNNYHPIESVSGNWKVTVSFENYPSSFTISDWSQNEYGVMNSPYFQTDFPWNGNTNSIWFDCSPSG